MTVLEQQPLTLSISLYEDPAGVLRVGKSRVLLELVIHAFQRGETPEGIVQSYDALNLPLGGGVQSIDPFLQKAVKCFLQARLDFLLALGHLVGDFEAE